MAIAYQSGDIIGDRYQIVGILGRGGVAVTYQAISIDTKSNVAIKVVSLKQLDNWKQIELFHREAEVLAKLNHPAIPRYIDYFDLETDADKVFYIVQQQAPGKSLSQLVESGWRTTEVEIKHIARQVLEILSYLHSLDPPVIHRDIKPSNLIRDDDGKIYLVDFGAVQNTYYNTLMQGSTVVGTYGYMAPEQFRGKALPSTDLYSLGATVLYLLTQRSPAELPQETLKLDFRNSVNISESFANWLDKMLEPDIEDRFADANTALAELFKTSRKRQGKLIAGVSTAILAIGLIAGINSCKWFFLSRLGFYPTNICSINLRTKVVKDYLKGGGSLTFYRNEGFWEQRALINCVIKAISKNNQERVDIINLLIEKGAELNLKGKNGNTPLLNAVIGNNTEAVKKIIENGADANIKNVLEKVPLEHAVNVHGNADIVEMLLMHGAKTGDKKGKDFGYLYIPVARGNHEIVKLLLKYGADVNYKDGLNRTPLSVVSNESIAHSLIQNGADINIQDNDGQTPLFKAVCESNKNIVRLFIDAGADVNHVDVDRKNALFCTAKKGIYTKQNHNDNLEIFENLINAGININAEDSSNETSIFNAVRSSNIDTVRLLIENGANVNVKNFKSETPLFYTNHHDLAKVLVENGADANVKDKNEITPLHKAIYDMGHSFRDIDSIKLLIDAGARTEDLNLETMQKLYDLNDHEQQKVQRILEIMQSEKIINREAY